jgi:hypothetical protein
MSENIILKEYYKKFDEFPYLLMTQSYEDDDYQFLMASAINRETPLTPKEIAKYFNNNYDLVENDVNENFDPDQEDDYE